jgi:hypothetical protein
VTTRQGRTTREQPIDKTVANRLMALLAPAQRRQLVDRCAYVDVIPRAGLELGRGRDAYSYFPVDCVISVLAPVDERPGIEVAAVGHEGLFGPQSWLGVRRTNLRGTVAASGHAWRIGHRALGELTEDDDALRQLLQQYVHVLLAQTARNAACCRFHSLGQRLARWLLTHADGALVDDILVTHERRATLLGAQRAGITLATGRLERRGLIGTGRGHILLLDRTGLAAEACSCYAANLRTYVQAIKRPPSATAAATAPQAAQGRRGEPSHSRPRLAAKTLAAARERTRSLT